MASHIPKEAVEGNALFEGYHKRLPDDRAAPYLCPARVATIGFGTTQLPDGRKVSLQMAPISRELAKAYMANDLQIAGRGIDRHVKIALHDLQRAALLMFTNNCGTGALQHSTLLFFVNRKEWQKAGREFLKWVNGGGQRLTGLVRRRQYESEMFLRGSALKEDDASKPIVSIPPAERKPMAEPVQQPPSKQSWLGRFWRWFD